MSLDQKKNEGETNTTTVLQHWTMKRQERAREIEIEEKINKEKMFEYSKVEITHTYFNEAFHLEILIQNWKKKKQM